MFRQGRSWTTLKCMKNYGKGCGDRSKPQWVQGKALKGGPRGRSPTEARELFDIQISFSKPTVY